MPPPPKFKKGQVVTCLDDSGFVSHGETFPAKGKNYTIRNVISQDSKTCLQFEEIRNNPLLYADGGPKECSFNGTRFKVRKGRG